MHLNAVRTSIITLTEHELHLHQVPTISFDKYHFNLNLNVLNGHHFETKCQMRMINEHS